MGVFYRRLPKFEYISPESLNEALAFLKEKGAVTKITAGGTDVIVQLRRREITIPEYVMDIKKIGELQGLRCGSSGLSIGALATVAEAVKSQDVKKNFPALHQAALNIASVQIRNRATFAGNICNAVPSADSAPSLIVYGAEVHLKSAEGSRTVPLKDFFTGPKKTVIAPDEILTEISVPAQAEGTASVYLKHSQRHSMDLAVVGAAVAGQKKNETFSGIRICLGAAAPVPMRAYKTEQVLEGKQISADLIDKAAMTAAQECSPIDDHRASAEYRRDIVQVLVRRALSQLFLQEQ